MLGAMRLCGSVRVGGRSCAGADDEQGIEGGMACSAPIEAEHELVKVMLEVCFPQSVIDAQAPKEFLRLFEYYVVATYSDRLSEYVGGGVAARVIGSRLDPDGTIVSSEFNRGS